MNTKNSARRSLGQDRLQVVSDVRFRAVFDEGVVIRQRAAEVLVLNEVGVRILDLISERRTSGEIVEVLGAEFEASAEQLEIDLHDFTDRLIEAGVIERVVVSGPESNEAVNP